MALSEVAQRIWDLSDEFIKLSLEHLMIAPMPDRSSEDTFDFGPEVLRVELLFPGIRQDKRELLVNLRMRRWMLDNARRFDKKTKTVKSASAEEHTEASVAATIDKVNEFLPRMRPIHREIIRERFFVQDKS